MVFWSTNPQSSSRHKFKYVKTPKSGKGTVFPLFFFFLVLESIQGNLLCKYLWVQAKANQIPVFVTRKHSQLYVSFLLKEKMSRFL